MWVLISIIVAIALCGILIAINYLIETFKKRYCEMISLIVNESERIDKIEFKVYEIEKNVSKINNHNERNQEND